MVCDPVFCIRGAGAFSIILTLDSAKPLWPSMSTTRCQWPVSGIVNRIGDFFGNAADELVLQGFRKALEIGAVHQPDIGEGRQRDLDHGSGTLLLEIVVAITEGRLRHCAFTLMAPGRYFTQAWVKEALGRAREAVEGFLNNPALMQVGEGDDEAVEIENRAFRARQISAGL